MNMVDIFELERKNKEAKRIFNESEVKRKQFEEELNRAVTITVITSHIGMYKALLESLK